MTSFWDRIKSKEKTAPVDNVGALRASLSKLDIRGEHHRFLVNRMGSSGSTWLVKLLNSHPDVFCYHEGVLAQIYPLKSYTSEHVVNFIRWLAWDDMHAAGWDTFRRCRGICSPPACSCAIRPEC
ncbi:MAG: hypothetical protein DMG84_11255 [Acidobacteria bacterium]|nr:MAG: hypothetical protein DMG84_11255 [Acidobacteriota bacterium]